MQVTEMLADDADRGGKKKREEREMQLAREAEMEKLLDKEWKEGTLPARGGDCRTDCSLVEEME